MIANCLLEQTSFVAPLEAVGDAAFQNSELSDSEALRRILEGNHIAAVYQPIVSLADGQVFGYEALSRIVTEELQMNIEQMFRTADRTHRSWELERLCRMKALVGASGLAASQKLFLNVNPNIIHDERFMGGFTKFFVAQFGLDFQDVVFEINERTAVIDNRAFLNSISHYKKQQYGIAIDDVGAGYSGLNSLASVKPDFIKLDMHLIRDIDKDELKQLLCKAMVDFSKSAGMKVVAEGIETEEELAVVIRLQVDLGQGYFLGVPKKTIEDVDPEKAAMVSRYHEKKYIERHRSSIYPIIGHLAKPGRNFAPSQKTEEVYETITNDPSIREFVVLEGDKVVGFITRTALNEKLGGRFGFALNSRRPIRELVDTSFLTADFKMTVDQVSRLAMQRSFECLYNPIVVERDGQYFGMVTVKDLLSTCTKIEVDIAVHSSPLTGLPGNLLIEQEIVTRLFGNDPYCITYYDIDNFKAYNDAYGFQNGDLMLKMLAGALIECATKNEFIGHIGGDDFIVIGDYSDGENYCQSVIDAFSSQVISLYRDEDIANGFVVSKNRNGVTENFPLATLSIAGASSRHNKYANVDEFSKDIAKLKKICKQQLGHFFEIQ
ncbi:MAG: EAL and GGDEF domain-containing protein [Holophagaceae bacterium]|nr:EAL and GGDEF domain-containing protein [Holophagaceae bacterium]